MSEALLAAAIRLPSASASLVEALCAEPTEAVARRLHNLPAIGGAMVLRTCERFEVYVTSAAGERLPDPAALTAALPAGAHQRELDDALILRGESDAAAHLLRVAAGLDSRIVGESQIAGQVRRAYLLARAAGTLDATLCALGRAAIHVGRCVARDTTLHTACRGLAERVADLIVREGTASAKRIGVLGRGHLAAEVVRALRAAPAGTVTALDGRAQAANQHVAEAGGNSRAEYAALAEALIGCDIVIACTSRSGLIGEAAAAAWAAEAAPRLVIDLGVPRNVSPLVEQVAGVRVVALEAFFDAAGTRAEQPGVREAETIAAREVDRFERWRAARRRLVAKRGRAA